MENETNNTTVVKRIIVEEVTIITKPEYESKYYNEKTNSLIDWYKHSKLDDKEKKAYRKVEIPNGDFETVERTNRLYEQDLTTLDVADLAIYVNRPKSN